MNKPSISDKYSAYSFLKIIVDTEKFQKDLIEVEGLVRRFSKTMTTFGTPLQEIGETLFAPFAKGASVFAAFDDVMRRVGAVTAASVEKLSELGDLAKSLGASTAFTAAQVAAGMQSLGMMGFSTEEIRASTAAIMNLSQATGTELAVAATIAANNLRVFGMGAKDIGKVSDYLAATANGSAQTLTDLGEALKTAGPAAASVGQTVRQTSAALGVLANMGIRGSVAGTALARSYRQIADPQVREYLRSLGVSVTDSSGNLRNMASVFADVGRAISGMGSADQVAALEKIFGARGVLAGQTLSINPAGLDEFMRKLDDSAGYCERAARQMEDGLGGAFRSVQSAVEAFQIAIGEAFSADYVVTLVNGFAEFVRMAADLVEFLGPVVPAVAAVAGAFILLGGAMKTLGAFTGIYTLFHESLPTALQAVSAATLKNTAVTGANVVAKGASAAAAGADAAANTASAGAKAADAAASKANAASVAKEAGARGVNTVAAAAETTAVGANTTAKGANAVASAAAGAAAAGAGAAGAGAGVAGAGAAAAGAGLKAALGKTLAFAMNPVFAIPALVAAVGYAVYRILRWSGESAAKESARQVDAILSESDGRIRAFEARHQDGKMSTAKMYEAYEKENKELLEEYQAIASKRNDLAAAAGLKGFWAGGNSKAVKELAAQEDRLRERILENMEARRRLLKEVKERQAQAEKALDDAEDAFYSKGATALEKELEDNQRKLDQLDAMYDAQMRLARARRDYGALEDLRARREDAWYEARLQREEILAAAARSAGFTDVDKDMREREQKRAGDARSRQRTRFLDGLKDANPQAYAAAIQSALAAIPGRIQAAAELLRQAQMGAQGVHSDGGVNITDAEKERISELRKAYEELQGQKDDFSRRLAEMGGGVSQAVRSLDVSPVFSTRALQALMGRDGSGAQRQQLRYTRDTAENTRKTAEDVAFIRRNYKSSEIYFA